MDACPEEEAIRRRLEVATPPTADGANLGENAAPKQKEKKSRRTSKEVQRHNGTVVSSKKVHSQAMKVATTLIKRSLDLPKDHPDKKSISQIVKATNKRYKSNVNATTASRYVRKGLIGVSPLGDFSKPVYSALMGAYASYLKLEQAESKKQSGLKQMAKLVNATVNAGGFDKKRDDLTRKLQHDTADQFQVGKANVEEYRRVQWTTAYNLDKWFSTWKETLIALGFARDKEGDDGDDIIGEVVFLEGQLR